MHFIIKRIEPCCDKNVCMEKYNRLKTMCGECDFADESTICHLASLQGMNSENSLQCCEKLRVYFEKGDVNEFKLGSSYIYMIDNSSFDFYVLEKDIAHNSITIFKGKQNYSLITYGDTEINCVFDIDKLPDFHKLREFGYNSIPSFHEAHIESLSGGHNNMTIMISGGFSPLRATVKIVDIRDVYINSTDSEDIIDYFSEEGRIGAFYINTLEDGYRVFFENNYTSFNGECKTKHVNQYIIRCGELHLEFEKR